MWRYASRRLAESALLLWVILTATFFLIHAAPGEPIWLQSTDLPPAAADRLRDLYGLDRPLPVQYLHWLGAVLQGDWGSSFSSARPAMGLVLERLPASLVLAGAVLLIEHLAGVLLGTWAALTAGSAIDRSLRALALLANAFPAFVLAALSIELFAIRWSLLPPQQMSSLGAESWPWPQRLADLLTHLALPAAVFAAARFGGVFRFVRNGLLDVLGSDHVRFARALGIGERRILWRFGLPHTLGPLIQRLGIALPMLLSGSMILEVIFSWPGLGWLIFTAFFQRDYPVLLAATALSAVLVVLGNWAADTVAALVDPRMRDAGT